jgi:hypothetical protein
MAIPSWGSVTRILASIPRQHHLAILNRHIDISHIRLRGRRIESLARGEGAHSTSPVIKREIGNAVHRIVEQNLLYKHMRENALYEEIGTDTMRILIALANCDNRLFSDLHVEIIRNAVSNCYATGWFKPNSRTSIPLKLVTNGRFIGGRADGLTDGVLVEMKTGNAPRAADYLQIAMYLHMALAGQNFRVDRAIIVNPVRCFEADVGIRSRGSDFIHDIISASSLKRPVGSGLSARMEFL